jgi:hypothetical protein
VTTEASSGYRNSARRVERIVQDALRDAATAPTVFDALDVTGDALRRLAELARAEVQYG